MDAALCELRLYPVCYRLWHFTVDIEQVNKGRSNHYFQYTGRRWTDAHDYDLVLNTSKLGISRCADIIADCVQKG